MAHISLAWLYWNPSKEAFSIPYISLPIAWYGILFALGFIVGYFLLLPMFKKIILQNNQLYARDILNWKLFTEQFQALLHSSRESSLLTSLNSQSCKELKSLPKDAEPSTFMQHSLLESLNQTLKNSSVGITRADIQAKFPGSLATPQYLSTLFADRLTWFVVISTIIGARLGHILFYDWPYYAAHPIEIFMLRRGGLASHGGTLFILLGLFLFVKVYRKTFPEISFISLVDILVIPTAFAAGCIRIGNFVNQEILGSETTLPWAVVFGHPADGSLPAPRHPVQLYEAGAYFFTFILLYTLWEKKETLKPGILSGLFFILVFGLRFLIEFLKLPQSMVINENLLQMGQYLSVPFILLGISLLILPKKTTISQKHCL